MQRGIAIAIVAMAIALVAAPSFANNVGVDVFIGNAWHTNQSIKVGQHYIHNPQWETRPFSNDYWYYAARIRWGGIELEWLHDKVYMGYDTPNIKGFNISDGYNFLLLNKVQTWGRWEGRLGAGPIIVHPEGIVDGYEIGQHGGASWRLGGIGFQGAVGYRGNLWGGLSYIVEGKMTTGVVHLTYPSPVYEIYAPTTGVHLLFGIGYDL